METLLKGFRWIIGDGEEVVEVKDPWVCRKADFKVENSDIYEERINRVFTLFLPRTKNNGMSTLSRYSFTMILLKAILAISVPQRNVRNRVV